MQISTIE